MFWSIWPQKSSNLVDWGRNYSHFSFPDYWKYSRLGFFKVFCHFHPYSQCQNTSGHHGMHLHMWKHDISHKNHQNWLIGAEITAIFYIRVTGKILALGFFILFAICTLISNARALFRHHGMHLHMRKHDFSLKNHQNWSISGEIMANFQIVNISSSLDLKIGHYICPNGPILMIFVAKIMLSHV